MKHSSMSPNDYQFLTQFLLERSGLSLGTGKEYLLEGRLDPLSQSLGMQGLSDLVTKLRLGTDKNLAVSVVEAMTTNETLFFRDRTPFDDLTKTIIPGLLSSNLHKKKIRIWSAACSSGQEAYSIFMTLQETFSTQLAGWTIEIVGTDIDTKMIERARLGIYSQFEVQRGLPIKMLMKYFEQHPQGWKMKDQLKTNFQWKFWNLLDSFAPMGMFDIIFCRNVLIYFNTEKKAEILTKMSNALNPGGVFVLGSAETILSTAIPFRKRTDLLSSAYEPATSKLVNAG